MAEITPGTPNRPNTPSNLDLRFWRRLLDAIPSPIFFKDDQGVYRECNQAFVDYLGLAREEIIGQTVYGVSPPEFAEKYHEMDLDLMRWRKPQQYEHQVTDSHSVVRETLFTKAVLVDESDSLMGLVGIMVDISGRKRAEREVERLHSTERIFSRVTEQLLNRSAGTIKPVLVNILDQFGEHLRVDGVCLAFEKGTPHSSTGTTAFDFVLSENVSEATARCFEESPWIMTQLNEACSVSFSDLAELPPSGHEFRERARAAGIRAALVAPVFSQGKLACWIAFTQFSEPRTWSFNDMTLAGRLGTVLHAAEDRARAECLISEQRMKMIQAGKMSALGEMAGGIAHEINNPLAIITMISEELKDRTRRADKDTAFVLTALDTIEKTALRIATIVRGLRSFARETGDQGFEVVTLQSIVEDTLTLCQERLKKNGVSLRVAVPEQHIQLECRGTQVSQVLLNLLNNAFDAVSKEGERWISLDASDKGTHIQLSVTDSGHGIAEDVAEKIMQPFFTTKEIGQGTGLGLSISKGLIEAHRGRLWLDRNTSNTRFVVELPKNQ